MTPLPLPPPPPKLTVVAPEIRARVLAGLNAGEASAEALAWAEKLRRFVGLYGNSLNATARRRFGDDLPAMAEWIVDVLLAASNHSTTGPVDALFLNGALTAQGLLPSERRANAIVASSQKLQMLASWHARGASLPALPTSMPWFEFVAGRWRTEAEMKPSIVIVSPSPFSLLTLTVIGILVRLSIPIAGLLVRRFTLSRFADEYRRDGARLIYKVWRKLIVRGDENPDETTISLKRVADAVACGHANAVSWCRNRSVPIASASDFDSPGVLDWLKAIQPDFGLFTGGGLVSSAVQEKFRTGIINPHMGHLPYYRGMDVVQWPILEGRLANVGVTAHLMDAGLDTGPIVQAFKVDPRRYRTIGALRNVISGLMPLILVDTALGLASGRLAPLKQTNVHPQYFYVHEALLAILGDRLRATRGEPDADSTDVFEPYLAELAKK